MKLLKVRIRRGDHTKGEDQLVYPTKYDPVEIDRIGMSAPTINHAGISMSGEVGRGGSEEWCIIAMPDVVANEYALDPDMQIRTSAECDTDMEAWRIQNGVPEERVYPEIVNAIKAKQDANIALSPGNMNALDVNHPEKGINKARRNIQDILGLAGKITEPVR